MTEERPDAPDVSTTTRTATLRIELDRAALAMEESTRAAGEESRGIPVTFSSEHPVERYDWWEDERYLEVLEHSPSAVDLSRAVNGLPFVDTHNIYSVSAQLGRVMDVSLRADGKLAGRLMLSRRQSAEDYRRDLMDGLVGEVSVGYRIDPTRVDRKTAEGQLPRYVVKRWTPHEVSAVPVPADPTVGVGRSMTKEQVAALSVPRPVVQTRADAAAQSLESPPAETAPKGEERVMAVEETTATPNGAPAVTVTRSEGENPNNDTRRRALAELAEKHGVQDVFARGMANGADIDTISRDMMGALQEQRRKGPQFGAPVTLTEKEERQYSVAQAILQADSGDKGFEREVSDEIQRHLPKGYNAKGTGLFIPTNLKMRTSLEAGTSSLGGAAVFTEYGGMIDYLRNQSVILRAGARLLSGLSAPVSFVKQTGTGTAYWVDETPGSDVTESNLTLGLVTLTPKTLQATQAFSRQLLIQAQKVMNAETKIREDLTRLHALAIDKSGINGTGTLQPLGITLNTSAGTVTMGAAGAVPTYDVLVDQEVQVRTANVNGPISYVTTPGIAGKLKKTQKFATTNGEPVWTGSLLGGVLNGAPAYATNQVPSNLTKGTSTTICHAIIAGAWQHMLVGEFGAAEIITDPFAKKKQGLIEVTSFQMVDIAIEYDTAFSLILDAKVS